MLPKKNRLTKKKDFDFIFKKGQTAKSGFLIFKFLKNRLNEDRFGIIVSKKVSNKSVQRNLVKRRLRKAISDSIKDFKNHQYLDVIIMTLPGVLNKSFSEIKIMVNKFLKDNLKKI